MPIKVIRGKFLGVFQESPMSTLVGVVLRLRGGRPRVFYGEQRLVRDFLEGSKVSQGDNVVIHFKADWEWAIALA